MNTEQTSENIFKYVDIYGLVAVLVKKSQSRMFMRVLKTPLCRSHISTIYGVLVDPLATNAPLI